MSSKRYYASAVQLVSMTRTTTPYQQLNDYNLSYLDGQLDTPNWARLILKSGKQPLTQFAHWIKTQNQSSVSSAGLNVTLRRKLTSKGDVGLSLFEVILKDLGINKNDLSSYGYDVFNPNDDEITWSKYQLGWDWDNDEIVIDNIHYTYAYHEWNDLTSIKVYLRDNDGSFITKDIQAFHMFAGSGETIKCSEYILINYVLDNKTYYWLQQIPVNDANTENIYTYTDNDGNTYDFTAKEDAVMQTIPLIPIKQGGYWHNNWHHPPDGGEGNATLTAWRIAPKRYGDSSISTECSDELRKKVANTDNKRKKLYKKARFTDRIWCYNLYKKACKKCGLDIRAQIGVPYDVMCQFTASKGTADQTREVLYDCFVGFGMPLHAIRNDDVDIVANSNYSKKYAELLKDTDHPWRAKYAKYTRFTSDPFFACDQDSEGNYSHDHFGVLSNKSYKKKAIRSVAKYLYNFFDMYQGSSNGRQYSITWKQGKNYNSTQSWSQYIKRRVYGKPWGAYWYDFDYGASYTTSFLDVEFTGRYNTYTETKYYSYDYGDGHSGSYNVNMTIKVPIYLKKEYEIEVETNIDDDVPSLENIYNQGVPIYEKYFKLVTNIDKKTYELDHTEKKGAVYYGNNPILNFLDQFKIVSIKLKSLEETTKIRVQNIGFADVMYIDPTAEYWETLDGDGNVSDRGYYQYWQGPYLANASSYSIGVFQDINVVNEYPDDIQKAESDGSSTMLRNLGNSYRKGGGYSDIVSGHGKWTGYNSDGYPTNIALHQNEKTYILYNSTEGYAGENITMRYQKKIDDTHYYEIAVKNYNIEWKINPYKGNEHQAGSFSALAPDGICFIPVIPDIVKKTSFTNSVFLFNLAYKQYWAYWKSEKKSWWTREGRGIVFSIILVVVVVIINIATLGQAMPLTTALLIIGLGLLLHFVVKLLGWEDTILGVVVETVGQVAIAAFTGGINMVFTLEFMAFTALNFSLNLTNVIINRDLEKDMNKLSQEEDDFKDESLIWRNTSASIVRNSGLLSTEAIVKHMTGLYIGQYTAIDSSTRNTNCSNDCVMQIYSDYNSDYVDATTHVELGM